MKSHDTQCRTGCEAILRQIQALLDCYFKEQSRKREEELRRDAAYQRTCRDWLLHQLSDGEWYDWMDILDEGWLLEDSPLRYVEIYQVAGQLGVEWERGLGSHCCVRLPLETPSSCPIKKVG